MSLQRPDDAERLVQREGVAGLRAALSSEAGDSGSGWLAFWRGYAAQFDDMRTARAEWLKAEALFAAERDTAGLDLAACALVQCVLLDSQTYDGFEARAERVERMPLPPDAASPLGLFQVAARTLLATERRDAIDAHAADIEHALAALGGDLDADVRLRTATSALHLLGLALDRVRNDDFHAAGTRVAASPGTRDFNRALWHLYAAESRFYDPSCAARVRADLDRAETLADGPAAASLRTRTHLLRAALALGDGDATAGRTSLDAAHRLLDPAHPQDYWAYHYFSSRHALVAGDHDQALAHASLSRRIAEAHVRPARITTLIMQEGFVAVALGRFDEAEAAFMQAADASSGGQAVPCLCHAHLARALRHLRDGALDDARAELQAGFADARGIGLTHFLRALPRVAAELCGAALDLDADVAFAGKAIAARSLACPDAGIARWPRPLRLRSLGGFAIERDGEPFTFARKAPKRLLELLRLMAALGGRQVDTARVAETLWPDAEGDEARDSLKALLHRARALLGADALVVRDGQLSFDEDTVMLDTWAVEHVMGRIEWLLGSGRAAARSDDGEIARRRLQLVALYRGHFLGEGELPAWAVPLRDRLRARYVRAMDMLGQRLEQDGQLEAAIALYRAALEHDNLAEDLYQRLIACHLVRGESAQALQAYRRCRELLSIVLGLRPSPRTEALAARITAG